MKHITKLLLITLCILSISDIQANDFGKEGDKKMITINAASRGKSSNDIIEGGFFLNFGAFAPSRKYMMPIAADDLLEEGDPKFGMGYNLEIGNMFNISNMKDKAIGAKVSWLALGYTSMTIEDTTAEMAFSGNIIKAGPYYSHQINKKSAVDAYYQISPTYTYQLEWEASYIGLTHALGVGYRYNIFSVNLDYNFGNIKDSEILFEPNITSEMKDWYKVHTGNARLTVGFRF